MKHGSFNFDSFGAMRFVLVVLMAIVLSLVLISCGNDKSCNDEKAKPVIHEEHEYVDLGLPSGTLWATCNVGANTPEQCGDFFAWGETEPKELDYKWKNYKLCNGSLNSLTKYCTKSDYGTVDNKTELEPENDAAQVKWGSLWRIPSEEQLSELKSQCSWTRTTHFGMDGYLITGPNGNTIFFPFSGYWTRTVDKDQPYRAYGLSLADGHCDSRDRYKVHRVRAVRVLPVERLFLEQERLLDFGESPIGETRTGELTIINHTLETKTLTVTADAPFFLEQEDGVASSITVVVPKLSRKSVTVMFTATKSGIFKGNVTFSNTSLEGGQSVIPLQASAYSGVYPQHEYVDLGLPSGTLWATCNIGTSAPEGFGYHFAWGETKPKEIYNDGKYKWLNGNGYTKYSEGIDNKTKLDPIDDAAYVNWGPKWRMPTKEQQQELIDNCTWTWTARNNVNGMLVTGPNGNKMFLPAAGTYGASDMFATDRHGSYISCDRYELKLHGAWAVRLIFSSDDLNVSSHLGVREGGNSVRAVRVSRK